jgi:hypothetical protein
MFMGLNHHEIEIDPAHLKVDRYMAERLKISRSIRDPIWGG